MNPPYNRVKQLRERDESIKIKRKEFRLTEEEHVKMKIYLKFIRADKTL